MRTWRRCQPAASPRPPHRSGGGPAGSVHRWALGCSRCRFSGLPQCGGAAVRKTIALGHFCTSLTLNLAYVTFRAVNSLTPCFRPITPQRSKGFELRCTLTRRADTNVAQSCLNHRNRHSRPPAFPHGISRHPRFWHPFLRNPDLVPGPGIHHGNIGWRTRGPGRGRAGHRIRPGVPRLAPVLRRLPATPGPESDHRIQPPVRGLRLGRPPGAGHLHRRLDSAPGAAVVGDPRPRSPSSFCSSNRGWAP